MSFLTNEQKTQFGGIINTLGYILSVAVMVALASKFLLSGYPPLIAWLEPFAETVIVLGAAALGVVFYSNNKLIK